MDGSTPTKLGPSPLGLWQAVDDPSTLVRIESVDGALRATFDKGGKVLFEGMKPDSGKALVWSGGKLLHDAYKTAYDCVLALCTKGQTLEIRGYAGALYRARMNLMRPSRQWTPDPAVVSQRLTGRKNLKDHFDHVVEPELKKNFGNNPGAGKYRTPAQLLNDPASKRSAMIVDAAFKVGSHKTRGNKRHDNIAGEAAIGAMKAYARIDATKGDGRGLLYTAGKNQVSNYYGSKSAAWWHEKPAKKSSRSAAPKLVSIAGLAKLLSPEEQAARTKFLADSREKETTYKRMVKTEVRSNRGRSNGNQLALGEIAAEVVPNEETTEPNAEWIAEGRTHDLWSQSSPEEKTIRDQVVTADEPTRLVKLLAKAVLEGRISDVAARMMHDHRVNKRTQIELSKDYGLSQSTVSRRLHETEEALKEGPRDWQLEI